MRKLVQLAKLRTLPLRKEEVHKVRYFLRGRKSNLAAMSCSG